jgi:hypothetical protein
LFKEKGLAGNLAQTLDERLVRAEGLEPPQLSSLEPKSSASTNSATPADSIMSDGSQQKNTRSEARGDLSTATGHIQWKMVRILPWRTAFSTLTGAN